MQRRARTEKVNLMMIDHYMGDIWGSIKLLQKEGCRKNFLINFYICYRKISSNCISGEWGSNSYERFTYALKEYFMHYRSKLTVLSKWSTGCSGNKKSLMRPVAVELYLLKKYAEKMYPDKYYIPFSAVSASDYNYKCLRCILSAMLDCYYNCTKEKEPDISSYPGVG